MSQLLTAWFGSFRIDDDTREARLFPRDPAALAERLTALAHGEILTEERELAAGGEVTVAEPRLHALGALTEPVADPTEWAGDYGYDEALLREATLWQAQRAVHTSASPDRELRQAVEALNEAHETVNLLGERLAEWRAQRMGEPRVPPAESAPVLADDPAVPAPLADLARAHLAAETRIAGLRAYLADETPRIAPSLAALLDAQLAARLITAAGGLARLARLPSSTIQLLGAEKALFRHLTGGGRPPKHGLLLQHPFVHAAPRREQGRRARRLAGKAAIAARVDHFGGEPAGARLRAELEGH